ncbi:MAG: DUF1501 domain-containing protein [Thiotrichaceae bacterium]
MKRREFLKLTAALSAASVAPAASAAAINGAVRGSNNKVLVLVHLAGGNDGLNTLIPYTDPEYYALRPTLAIPANKAIPLDSKAAMHPSLALLKPYWDKGEMAWLQGLGYNQPDRSHFRSIDIWESASSSNERSTTGWLSHVLPQLTDGLHGIVLGQGIGPLAGAKLNAVEMENPKTFLNQAKLINDMSYAHSNVTSMRHILAVQNQLYSTAAELSQKLRRRVSVKARFPKTPFGHQMQSIAEMIVSGVDSPVYKAKLAGFDTHAGQLNSHKNSLYHLSGVLQAFAESMQRAGRWDDVVLMTYSEFGRRAKENHSGGTDHGKASAHLVMGGSINGGLYGKSPDLHNLDNGDVRYSTDFKAVYGSLARRWWNVKNPWQAHGEIPFV